VISVFMFLMHSAITPTEVLRSIESLLLAYFMMGFWKSFQSSAKVGPRAMERAMMTSRAVSMASQSYSEVPSRAARSSSSPKSFWQAWSFVMRARRVSVVVFSLAGSAIRAGPVTLRVEARERLISVTVALEKRLSVDCLFSRAITFGYWQIDQKLIRFLNMHRNASE